MNMSYVVTDHKRYKYFDDLKVAIDYIQRENNPSLKLYEDTGLGNLREITPVEIIRLTQSSVPSTTPVSSESSSSYDKEEIKKDKKPVKKEPKQKQESSASNALVSLIIKLIIVLVLLILYFVFLPEFVSNAIEGFVGG
ncbi:MAG: hypothetical protein PWQ28_424 [Candidatus Woesearchaeota archaeon]|nr:hypothetical protein [Candidatus Woesearchaeota archaeon]MDK2908352.1 hypothetical protein [Candidatus Woesearchaeota archaeon]